MDNLGSGSSVQSPVAVAASAASLTVTLVGNPNTGKTTLFNALAGMRQRVGNYPGVTVERKHGRSRLGDHLLEVIDLPGTYSLAPRSPDEMVAVDVVLGTQQGESRPDVIVSIVDASNLERNLYLTSQLLELGVPVVIALNMIDIAQGHGRSVDAERLQKQLGVRVVPIQANKKRGLEPLREALVAAAGEGPPPRRPAFPHAFEEEALALQGWLQLQSNGEEVPTFLVRRLLIDVGGYTERRLIDRYGPELSNRIASARQRLADAQCPVPAVEARTRYAWIREEIQGCVERPAERPTTWTERLDRVLTHKVWGTLVFLAVMFLVFQSIFTWAEPLMDQISKGKEALAELVKSSMGPGPLRSLLANGIVEGVGSVLVFLPQILILFAFIAILEDCGYMARAAFLMDKIMARCGLSGKSFIPLLSSFACAIPGVMAARVIEDRRDRLTTILVAPLMSCSARLPVYTLLIGAFIPTDTSLGIALPGLVLFAMYLIGIVVAPLVALLLKRTLLRGETPIFVMELPPYKLPALGTVLHRMYDRGWAFVRRAGTIILASMIVVWALLYFPHTGTDDQGHTLDFDRRIDELGGQLDEAREELDTRQETNDSVAVKQAKERISAIETEINHLNGKWKEQSFLGQMGHAIEPVVEPLGWNWKIGMAALASFPAREVVVGTLGIIYDLGEGQDEESDELKEQLQNDEWAAGSTHAGQKVFTIPAALSLMVFFALCCQCASTLAIIRRETNSWRWPVFTFVYMTILAYVAALLTYQIGSLIG